MPLAELLAPERIAILENPAGRDAVLLQAARLLVGPHTRNVQAIAKALQAREALASTAIGHGVAIPHARDAHTDHVIGAFLRLQPAVDFAAGNGEPVDLVFAMQVPEGETASHLQRLAQLAETFARSDFRDHLRAASDVDALRRCLLSS